MEWDPETARSPLFHGSRENPGYGHPQQGAGGISQNSLPNSKWHEPSSRQVLDEIYRVYRVSDPNCKICEGLITALAQHIFAIHIPHTGPVGFLANPLTGAQASPAPWRNDIDERQCPFSNTVQNSSGGELHQNTNVASNSNKSNNGISSNSGNIPPINSCHSNSGNAVEEVVKPFPTEPVLSRPIPSRSIPSRPIPSEPIPSEPIPSEPIPSRPITLLTAAEIKTEKVPNFSELGNSSTVRSNSQRHFKSSRSDLQKKQKPRSAPRPHICFICEQDFPKEDELNVHMDTHHKKKYKCDKCMKNFNKKSSAKEHVDQESEECGQTVRYSVIFVPYTCRTCWSTFATKIKLEKHKIRKHKGFQCESCLQCLPTQTELDTHMLTHNKKKSYMCQFCDEKFSSKSRLAVHSKVHE